MNMLPINAEWKRRIKWADKQKKQQKSNGKFSGQGKGIKQTAECNQNKNRSSRK